MSGAGGTIVFAKAGIVPPELFVRFINLVLLETTLEVILEVIISLVPGRSPRRNRC